MARPPARCLDLTRLLSRLGRGPLTGVDRVELAYLKYLSADSDVPLYLLARTALGYVLAGPDAAKNMLAGFEGQRDWGQADLIGRLSRKAHPLKRRAEADLRRHAVGRCRRGRLAAMLARAMPEGATYLNVGHSNLSEEVLRAWAERRQGRTGVLIHDTIPMDFPQFQREATAKQFRGKFARTMRWASHVIYSTHAVREAAERHVKAPRTPEAIVVPLGIDAATPDPGAVPADLALSPPFFLTIGTIEPRKNHALLLDVWEALGEDAPPLLIAGRRGWSNEAVFGRLDNAPMMGRTVFERGGLSDGALAALMQQATALLFPSLAEGFGLPPVEAAAHQLPVLCTDLAVYREVLGDNAVYLPGDDVYAWRQRITELTKAHRAGHKPTAAPFQAPTWTAHFDAVLKVL